MHKLLQTLLVGTALALAMMPAQAADRGPANGLGVADVDIDVGGRNGIQANVDASLGGKDGVDANVDVGLGGRKGLDADANATIGGKDAVGADVDVTLGGKNGIDAGVTAGIGNDVDVGLGVGGGDASSNTPGSDPAVKPGQDTDGGTLTTAQRQMFDRLSASDRKAMLKRCNSIGTGGYDPELVQLCKLLRLSASR